MFFNLHSLDFYPEILFFSAKLWKIFFVQFKVHFFFRKRIGVTDFPLVQLESIASHLFKINELKTWSKNWEGENNDEMKSWFFQSKRFFCEKKNELKRFWEKWRKRNKTPFFPISTGGRKHNHIERRIVYFTFFIKKQKGLDWIIFLDFVYIHEFTREKGDLPQNHMKNLILKRKKSEKFSP